MSTDGVLGAAYLPTDGYIDPASSRSRSPRARGGAGPRSTRSTRVTAIGVEHGRVAGVVTDKGAIETEIVVNAGGMFAQELGALAGVNVPIVPMAHEYLSRGRAGSRSTCRRCAIRRCSSTSDQSRAA